MTPIELDKLRNISYPLKSIRTGKKYFGHGLLSMISFENMGPDVTVDLLWLGLLHEDPTLKLGELDQIIEDWRHKEGNSFEILAKAVLTTMQEEEVMNFPGAAEKNLKTG